MELIENSIIIAAHPDDESLWFSSILSKVDKVILCFLPVVSNPTWTEGRRNSLSAYPLDNISCLGLAESEVFEGVDWGRPVKTKYGLRITENQLSDKVYRKNFDSLKSKLREHLKGYCNVFTHNPWGEYGHVEHVQVYRAVKALQKEMQFNLWFSNYASNKSANLMVSEFSEIVRDSMTLPTDKSLAKEIASTYKLKECWTWYDDYEWCDSETFINNTDTPPERWKYGTLVPINLIIVEEQPVQQSHLEMFTSRAKGKLRKLILKIQGLL